MRSSTLFALGALSLGFETVSGRVLERRSNNPLPTVTTHRASSTITTIPTGSKGNACAKASSASASYLAANPAATAARIAPSIALDCLSSVPVDTERDVALVDYLVPYLEVQSTLGYLKSPPSSYLLPPVDVLGGLQQIRKKLLNDGYKTQYDFALDLARIFAQASDGHFSYTPALLSVFSFQSTRLVVSVSKDGLQLPQVYDEDDAIALLSNSTKVSPVASVDGVPILEYIETALAASQSQDPDAQYNNAFDGIALGAAGRGKGFTGGSYPSLPDQSVWVFANGTKKNVPNIAKVLQDLTDITSGEDLHLAYEVPPPEPTETSGGDGVSSAIPTETATSTSSTAAFTPQPTMEGYPYPVAINKRGYLAGYLLNSTQYRDTAVLALTGFEASDGQSDDDELDDFRATLQTFFAAAKQANRTKLIIDVSANGGGFIFEGFELYRQLFPKAELWDASRIRATAPFAYVAGSVFGTNKSVDVVNNVVDEQGRAFTSFAEFFGPYKFPEDSETAVMRYNFSDATTTGFTAGNPFLSGFGPNATAFSKWTQPFAAGNIVVVTDGICASTCTIFTGLITREQDVRTIALGGRPIAAPMQAIGGVKGSQVLKFKDLQSATGQAVQALNGEAPFGVVLPGLGQTPLLPDVSEAGSFNYRNGYARDDTSTPLQFVYEAANCRRFYTPQTLFSIVASWESSAAIAWKGAKCAPGSTTNTDGTIGTKAPALNRNLVAARVNPYVNSPGSLNYTFSGGPYGNGTAKTVRRGQTTASLKPVNLNERQEQLWRRVPKEVKRNELWL